MKTRTKVIIVLVVVIIGYTCYCMYLNRKRYKDNPMLASWEADYRANGQTETTLEKMSNFFSLGINTL